jgi:signal transduction histidine kinase
MVPSVDPASIDILVRTVMNLLHRLSLSRQFLVASFPILLVAMLVIGLWVAHEIERGVVNRLGSVTSLYVDSLVAPHVQHLLEADTLDATRRKALDTLLTDTPLGQHILAFNIWRPDGRIAYSTNASTIGKVFPVGPGLVAALQGNLYSKIIERAEQEHGFIDSNWPPRLIETYTPIHAETLGRIVGVAEFYQTTDELVRETTAAQRRSWLVVAATMSIMYLMLFGVVRRGSQTIVAQRRELGDRVAELSRLLERNAKLDAKVRGAAAQATALNERFLRRISADLHDGPGQDLGYALMRLEAVADECVRTPPGGFAPGPLRDGIGAVQASLESALGELRAISAGLQLPEVENLSTSEIAARAVRDYERKTGAKPVLACSGAPVESSLPVKIALYRLLQESLANGFRHANAAEQRVTLSRANGQLIVEVRDSGPGFGASELADHGRIGLAGMRGRVEALGGSFEVHSARGRGTTVKASLPAQVPGVDDE